MKIEPKTSKRFCHIFTCARTATGLSSVFGLNSDLVQINNGKKTGQRPVDRIGRSKFVALILKLSQLLLTIRFHVYTSIKLFIARALYFMFLYPGQSENFGFSNKLQRIMYESKYGDWYYDHVLYNRLGTSEGDKDIFKLAKIGERKSKDLDHVKCIKSNDQKILVKDNDIKEKWREYFSKLLNEDYIGDIRPREDTSLVEHTFFSCRIRMVEVRKTLKQGIW